MSDDQRDPFADVINLLAAPIAQGLRTADSMRRGADELWRTVENVNRTMANLNETSERLNRLLAEIEEPVRAMMPQLTRTIRNADEITQRLEGPIRSMAPNMEQFAATFSSPNFAALPQQFSEFMAGFSELSKRLAPLTQLAENAGGLFGGFRIPGMPSRPSPSPEPVIVADEPLESPQNTAPPAKPEATKRQSGTKSAATPKRSGAKKASAKRKSTRKPAQATAKSPARRRTTGN